MVGLNAWIWNGMIVYFLGDVWDDTILNSLLMCAASDFFVCLPYCHDMSLYLNTVLLQRMVRTPGYGNGMNVYFLGDAWAECLFEIVTDVCYYCLFFPVVCHVLLTCHYVLEYCLSPYGSSCQDLLDLTPWLVICIITNITWVVQRFLSCTITWINIV